jgi:hypothetical protein
VCFTSPPSRRLPRITNRSSSAPAWVKKEPGRLIGPIGKNPQNREQTRPPLHFVDDDEPLEAGKCELRLLEPGKIVRVLQVEPRHWLRPAFRQLKGQGRLAYLAGAEDRHGGKPAQAVLNGVEAFRALNQASHP